MSYDDLLEDMEGSLCGREPEPGDLALPRMVPSGRDAMEQLETYWRELRGATLLPRRRDLDTSRIEAALPHAFILERVAPGVACVRTCGQILHGHMGFNARGMPLSLLFTPDGRSRLRVWLDRCLDEPAVVRLPITAWRGVLHPPSTGQMLLMPLRDQEDQVTRVVGGIFLDRAQKLSRVRFDVNEIGDLRYEKLRPAPQPVYAIPGDRPALAMAEPRRPYLRLVVSNP